MKVLNNPINPDKGETAQLFVALKNNSLVQADVLDRHGALIRRISDQEYIKGEHVIYWDGRNEANAIVASGIYMVRVKTGGKTTVQKIAVIR
jgi:flagellar hook assembly protein FlgD